MVERACVKRLQKEYHALCKAPIPQVVACPSPSDILEWHYVLEGSQGTPFAGGCYYGKIKFPSEYPYKPPSISMTTPNGRFAPNKKICLSMSDFHPESWNPMWSVSSILTGLLSFMMDKDQTTGSISTSDNEKHRLARLSLAYNCESKNCPNFKKLFPDYVAKYNQQLAAKESTPKPEVIHRHSSAPKILPSKMVIAGDRNKVADDAQVEIHARQKKPLPPCLLILLVSTLGAVMALPLLLP